MYARIRVVKTLLLLIMVRGVCMCAGSQACAQMCAQGAEGGREGRRRGSARREHACSSMKTCPSSQGACMCDVRRLLMRMQM